MATKLTITVDIETDEFDDSAAYDAEAAVKETMTEWGYEARTKWTVE